MRVCVNKLTGKLIESQSGGEVDRIPQDENVSDEEYAEYLNSCDAFEAARLGTLYQNALNAGYNKANIEVKYVTDKEYQAILEYTIALTPEEILKAEQENKIQKKIRDIAIEELKKDGELPEDYKD